jgi:L-asparaginase
MKFLTKDEKSKLIFLITAALGATAISIYLSVNIQKNNEDILSNKIHVIHTSGEIEDEFRKNYGKIGLRPSVVSYQPLQKSSDIVPNDWNTIATDIGKKYNNYDAFVIVCGKDTLTYTASALSFMMENLGKPIIFTDGEVLSAVKLASSTRIPEVMIASEGQLLRACRTIHKSLDYFSSPQYPPLDSMNCLQFTEESMKITFVNPKITVSVIKVFPGMTDTSFQVSKKVNGIVLEMYGNGTGPTSEKILNAISLLTKKGVVIIGVSQCDEIFNMDVNIQFLEAGVLSGGDMTTEAAYAKLYFLLSNVEDKKIIGQLMEKSFRGEMMIPKIL